METFSAAGDQRRRYGLRKKQHMASASENLVEKIPGAKETLANLAKTSDNIDGFDNVDGFDNAAGKKMKPAVKGALIGFSAIALATILIIVGKQVSKRV